MTVRGGGDTPSLLSWDPGPELGVIWPGSPPVGSSTGQDPVLPTDPSGPGIRVRRQDQQGIWRSGGRQKPSPKGGTHRSGRSIGPEAGCALLGPSRRRLALRGSWRRRAVIRLRARGGREPARRCAPARVPHHCPPPCPPPTMRPPPPPLLFAMLVLAAARPWCEPTPDAAGKAVRPAPWSGTRRPGTGNYPPRDPWSPSGHPVTLDLGVCAGGGSRLSERIQAGTPGRNAQAACGQRRYPVLWQGLLLGLGTASRAPCRWGPRKRMPELCRRRGRPRSPVPGPSRRGGGLWAGHTLDPSLPSLRPGQQRLRKWAQRAGEEGVGFWGRRRGRVSGARDPPGAVRLGVWGAGLRRGPAGGPGSGPDHTSRSGVGLAFPLRLKVRVYLVRCPRGS